MADAGADIGRGADHQRHPGLARLSALAGGWTKPTLITRKAFDKHYAVTVSMLAQRG